METLTQILSTENLEKTMKSFDFDLLFNNSGSGINYTEPTQDFMFSETTIQLEGMRKWKNDANVNYINRNK